MYSFFRKTTDTIQRYKMLALNDRVLIGLSGGPDSVALLLLMRALQSRFDLTLGIAHINHCLRGDESDRDEAFVRELAFNHQLPFYLEKTDVPARAKAEKRSFEEAARLVRYEFYEHLAGTHGYTKIALGHNSDDNAEQVLMNLLRGSGTKGLGGIPPTRPLMRPTSFSSIQSISQHEPDNAETVDDFNTVEGTETKPKNVDKCLIIRPLTETSRKEILEWLTEKQQNYVLDSSNADTTYLRNRIRNELLPHLQSEYNPSVVPSLNRLSRILMDEEAWMMQETRRLFNENVRYHEMHEKEVHLPRRLLNQVHPALAKRLTRHAIEAVKGDLKRIRMDHVEEILTLAVTKTDGSVLDLPGRVRIIKGFDVICFKKESRPLRELGNAVPNYLKKK